MVSFESANYTASDSDGHAISFQSQKYMCVRMCACAPVCMRNPFVWVSACVLGKWMIVCMLIDKCENVHVYAYIEENEYLCQYTVSKEKYRL